MRTPRMLVVLVAVALTSGLAACAATDKPSTTASSGSAAPAEKSKLLVPTHVKAGIVVYDRETKTFPEQINPDAQFRSASLVKLLIALDYFWERGPSYTPADSGDRHRLEIMLRSSDDDAASHFYVARGKGKLVDRMVSRLGLQHTHSPQAPRTGWGSTAVSAGDLVRVYRYILEQAPAPVRQFIMDNLHQSTRCGTDGYNQSFGIQAAFWDQTRATKQGWYEFANAPKDCQEAGPAPKKPTPATSGAAPTDSPKLDWDDEVLHSTGTVGENDRSIVVILTAYPSGTSFKDATTVITQVAEAIRLTN